MLLEGLEALIRSGIRKPIWTEGPTTHSVNIGGPDIEKLVSHRPPFLFVDRITGIDLDRSILRGQRFVSEKDPVFVGHFPGQPVYPGVLQLETMGQFGICLFQLAGQKAIEVPADLTPRELRAVRIHHAAFLKEVGPGQHLDLFVRIVSSDDYTGICAAQVVRNGEICSFGIMEVYFVED